MTDPDLIRAELLAARDSALEQIDVHAAALDGIIAACESVATDDEHDPEGATIAVERAQLAGLIDAARARVADLDAAIGRLDRGDYGVCQGCGGPVGSERLAARPMASACIGCASPRR